MAKKVKIDENKGMFGVDLSNLKPEKDVIKENLKKADKKDVENLIKKRK